jgi:hypothetical protein
MVALDHLALYHLALNHLALNHLALDHLALYHLALYHLSLNLDDLALELLRGIIAHHLHHLTAQLHTAVHLLLLLRLRRSVAVSETVGHHSFQGGLFSRG